MNLRRKEERSGRSSMLYSGIWMHALVRDTLAKRVAKCGE